MRGLLILLGLILTLQVFGQEYNHVFVFLNSNPDKEEISAEAEEALQKAHRANIKQLVEYRKLTVAGPFEGGGGIFILTTGKVAEAEVWLSSDPAVKANRWNIELFPVHFVLGGVCLAKEPNEMVVYNFTRVSYENPTSKADIWASLADQKDILMAGDFSAGAGGVIIYTGIEKNSWFDKNQGEQLSFNHKKLWVAKGSFCE